MVAITQIFPIAGVAGTAVSIRGTGFNAAAPIDHVVTFGGRPALMITVLSSQEMIATVPSGVSAGPVDVTVSADAGVTTATSAKAFYALSAAHVQTPGNLVQGGARAVFLDGRPVGFIDAPVRLAHDVVFGEADVEQEISAVKLFKQSERWRLRLSLAEVSLENLQIALGGTLTATGPIRALAVGGGSETLEHTVLVQGPGVSGKLRDFYAYRAVIVEHEPLLIGRDTPQRLPLTFRLLPEMSLPVGQRILRIAEQ